jgi:hypothetical protein
VLLNEYFDERQTTAFRVHTTSLVTQKTSMHYPCRLATPTLQERFVNTVMRASYREPGAAVWSNSVWSGVDRDVISAWLVYQRHFPLAEACVEAVVYLVYSLCEGCMLAHVWWQDMCMFDAADISRKLQGKQLCHQVCHQHRCH